MRKRERILLVALPVLILAILTGWFLFGQPPQAVSEPAPPATDIVTPEELPNNLLVIPEVPLGPLVIVLTCFVALLIAQRRSKA
jgi:hypothetical protein